MLSCTVYFVHLIWLNRTRDQNPEAGDELSAQEEEELGDLNPKYRYLL